MAAQKQSSSTNSNQATRSGGSGFDRSNSGASSGESASSADKSVNNTSSSGVAATVERKVDEVHRKAGEITSEVTTKAEQMVEDAGDKASKATVKFGQRMGDLAAKIRDRSPAEGRMAHAADAVAGGLEHTGQYIQDSDLKSIGNDISNVIRRYPVQSTLLGIGVGVLIARAASHRGGKAWTSRES